MHARLVEVLVLVTDLGLWCCVLAFCAWVCPGGCSCTKLLDGSRSVVFVMPNLPCLQSNMHACTHVAFFNHMRSHETRFTGHHSNTATARRGGRGEGLACDELPRHTGGPDPTD
jgi:hypothetical protein